MPLLETANQCMKCRCLPTNPSASVCLSSVGTQQSPSSYLKRPQLLPGFGLIDSPTGQNTYRLQMEAICPLFLIPWKLQPGSYADHEVNPNRHLLMYALALHTALLSAECCQPWAVKIGIGFILQAQAPLMLRTTYRAEEHDEKDLAFIRKSSGAANISRCHMEP